MLKFVWNKNLSYHGIGQASSSELEDTSFCSITTNLIPEVQYNHLTSHLRAQTASSCTVGRVHQACFHVAHFTFPGEKMISLAMLVMPVGGIPGIFPWMTKLAASGSCCCIWKSSSELTI